MNKGLEAWQKIKLGYICGQGAINEFALRENERENFKIIEKELESLNIILDCCDIELYRNRQGQCFINIGNHLSAISKENYDLLKEVLL